MIDRAALLVADIERLPSVLLDQATGPWDDLAMDEIVRKRSYRRIVFAGLGSSRFAALVVAPYFRAVGLDVVVEHASIERGVPVGPGTLLVAISNSGRTPEVVAAAERGRRGGATVLAITNNPESALAAAAEMTLPLTAGVEASGVASVSYGATIAVLYCLARASGVDIDVRKTLIDAARIAEDVIAQRDRWVPAAADVLGTGAAIHVLADAASLGTAEQAALLFREGPRLDADATDAGDWLHVGIYTALPGYRALLLAGTPYDVDLSNVIHERGGRIVVVGPREMTGADLVIPLAAGPVPGPLVRALVEPVVTTLIAADLWERAGAPHG